MLSVVYLLTAFFLVLLNGFFVAAEFAMVKLRHTRVQAIKAKYGLRGRILAQVHNQLDVYLSACQLGITLASLGLGWIGEPAFADLISPVFIYMGIISPATIKAAAYFIAFFMISFLHIVIGELMPKSLAIRQAEKLSLWTALPLYIFYWLMYPAIWVLNASANTLLDKLGLATIHDGEHGYSTEELKLILTSPHVHGNLSDEESEILEHTLEFRDLKVSDVMRPLVDMKALDITKSFDENLKTMLENRYSRYPIYENTIHDIKGIIHIKDLLPIYQQETIDFRSIMRPAFNVAHDLSALVLFRQFRQGVSHFAFVYSARDKLIGFVTLDNLLYALIGRIGDEFHRTRDEWRITKRGNFLMQGNYSIYTLERALNIKLPDDEVDTISGLILARLERLPVKGEKIIFKDFDIKIKKMLGHRIELVKIYPKKTRSSMS